MKNVLYVDFRMRTINLKAKRQKKSSEPGQFTDVVRRVIAAGASLQEARERALFGIEKRARENARQQISAQSTAAVISFQEIPRPAKQRARKGIGPGKARE